MFLAEVSLLVPVNLSNRDPYENSHRVKEASKSPALPAAFAAPTT